MEIDRENRDRLVDSINQYLSGDITAFEFDDIIHDRKLHNSDDPLIPEIVATLWCFYDDINNHTVDLNKESWDCFQRLILILKSDAQMIHTETKHKSYTQHIAFVSLIIFGLNANWFGLSLPLFGTIIALGIVSISLPRFREFNVPAPTYLESALTPFSSTTELTTVYHSVDGFKKQQYPGKLKSKLPKPNFLFRDIVWLSKLMETAMIYPTWILFSPFVLFAQIFPVTETNTRVQLAE